MVMGAQGKDSQWDEQSLPTTNALHLPPNGHHSSSAKEPDTQPAEILEGATQQSQVPYQQTQHRHTKMRRRITLNPHRAQPTKIQALLLIQLSCKIRERNKHYHPQPSTLKWQRKINECHGGVMSSSSPSIIQMSSATSHLLSPRHNTNLVWRQGHISSESTCTHGSGEGGAV